MKYIKDNVTGSYYSLENGELIQYAQNADGSRDRGTSCSVDWNSMAVEMPLTLKGKEVKLYRHLKAIEDKLKGGE